MSIEKSGSASSIPYTGPVHMLHLIDGAKQAAGLTVIIDVFRAFSLECYLFEYGVRQLRPVKTLEEAFAWKERDPDCVIFGERKGKRCEGCDYGNSPSVVDPASMKGRRIIHTTSAGTQGIANAANSPHVSEIITGSLVNARAVADYIIKKQPEQVSLVAMGRGGVEPAPEDELCALILRSYLRGEEMPDLMDRINDLKRDGGDHFFHPDKQSYYPEADYYLCIDLNHFPFVIRILQDDDGFLSCRTDRW